MKYLQLCFGRLFATVAGVFVSCGVILAQTQVENDLTQASSAPKQTQSQNNICSKKLSKSPQLRGFARLGMTAASLKARFPELKITSPDEFGVSHATFIYREGIAQARPGEFGTYLLPKTDAVAIMELDLIDGRVSEISLTYDNSTLWSTADQMVLAVAPALSLDDVWLPVNLARNRLECREFRITAIVETVENSKRSFLILKDLLSEQVVEDRKNKKRKHRGHGLAEHDSHER